MTRNAPQTCCTDFVPSRVVPVPLRTLPWASRTIPERHDPQVNGCARQTGAREGDHHQTRTREVLYTVRMRLATLLERGLRSATYHPHPLPLWLGIPRAGLCYGLALIFDLSSSSCHITFMSASDSADNEALDGNNRLRPVALSRPRPRHRPLAKYQGAGGARRTQTRRGATSDGMDYSSSDTSMGTPDEEAHREVSKSFAALALDGLPTPPTTYSTNAHMASMSSLVSSVAKKMTMGTHRDPALEEEAMVSSTGVYTQSSSSSDSDMSSPDDEERIRIIAEMQALHRGTKQVSSGSDADDPPLNTAREGLEFRRDPDYLDPLPQLADVPLEDVATPELQGGLIFLERWEHRRESLLSSVAIFPLTHPPPPLLS